MHLWDSPAEEGCEAWGKGKERIIEFYILSF
jgi:hypothetical protein